MPGKSLLLLSGSLRDGSSNTAAINTAATLLAPGWRGQVFSGMNDLPHFNPDVEAAGLPPAVVDLRQRIKASDAMLICTPEYAGALPGSFKNLLDWTVGGMETVDKPVAWLNVSSNATQASGAHNSLRAVLEYTGAHVIDAACVSTPIARADIDGGLVTNSLFIADATAAIEALVRNVEDGQ